MNNFANKIKLISFHSFIYALGNIAQTGAIFVILPIITNKIPISGKRGPENKVNNINRKIYKLWPTFMSLNF